MCQPVHGWILDTLAPHSKKIKKVMICISYTHVITLKQLQRERYKQYSCVCVSVCLVTTAYVKKNSKDIWSEEEVAEGSQYDDLADQRPQPE